MADVLFILILIAGLFGWLIIGGIRYDKKHFNLMVNDEVYRLCYSYTEAMLEKEYTEAKELEQELCIKLVDML